MSGFRRPELPRFQGMLFPPSLDDLLDLDSPVRLFEEILSTEEFEEAFEAMAKNYKLTEGKPPFHPKSMASLWLYCISQRMRSSREIEAACHHRIDVRWLMEGQTPDHSTICLFVQRHRVRLKKLLSATLRLAAGLKMLKVQHVAVDGSKVEANASAQAVKRRAALKRREAEFDAVTKEVMKDWEANELRERGAPSYMSNPLAGKSAAEKKAQLQAVLAELKEFPVAADDTEDDDEDGDDSNPLVFRTDPDARLMKDKEGRFKPNYTTQIGVDTETGLITAEDVTNAPWDGDGLLPMAEQTEANTGVKPEIVSADSAYNSGAVLRTLDEQQITAYMPDCGASEISSPERTSAFESSLDGQKLSCAEIVLITDARTKRLSREAFAHDAARDVCICPGGMTLQRVRTSPDVQVNSVVQRTQYRSQAHDCAGCALKSVCLSVGAKTRVVTRDQHEELRAALRRRMATSAGRAEYRKRTAAERAHSWLKTVAGLRKFLRRGLDGVRAEFTLTCAAMNMRILVARLAALRMA